jgi:hypothetical protein
VIELRRQPLQTLLGEIALPLGDGLRDRAFQPDSSFDRITVTRGAPGEIPAELSLSER